MKVGKEEFAASLPQENIVFGSVLWYDSDEYTISAGRKHLLHFNVKGVLFVVRPDKEERGK